LRDLYDRAVTLGWASSILGNGHVRLLPPGGGKPMVLSTTTSGKGRALQNSEAILKRWQRENTK
jgi:hypothetical protein